MYYPSSGEKTCIINGIKNNLRVDGRSLNDIRENWIALSTLKQANGSSTLQISDSHIIIYCGIKVFFGKFHKIFLKVRIGATESKQSRRRNN